MKQVVSDLDSVCGSDTASFIIRNYFCLHRGGEPAGPELVPAEALLLFIRLYKTLDEISGSDCRNT